MICDNPDLFIENEFQQQNKIEKKLFNVNEICEETFLSCIRIHFYKFRQ